MSATTITRNHKVTEFKDTTNCTGPGTGCAIFDGGVYIDKDLCVGGTFDVGDIISNNIYGGTTGSGADLNLFPNEDSPTDGQSVRINSDTPSTSSTTGALIVEGTGGLGVGGDIYGGTDLYISGDSFLPVIYGNDASSGNMTIQPNNGSTTGNVTIAATTNSTSSTTGALIVSGGMGVASDTFIGGLLNVTGGITGTLDTAAQPNVTSLGTLVSLDVDNVQIDGNTVTTTSGDLNVNATGNVVFNPTGGEVLLNADPISPLGAATKQYVDSAIQGLDIKESVRVKTNTTLPAYTASGTGPGKTLTANANGAFPTVDGITLSVNDRILVDTEGANNGIYELTVVGDGATPWELTRGNDFDFGGGNTGSSDINVTSGAFTFVEEGTSFEGNGYVLANEDPITIDTTVLSFTQFSGAGSVTVTNIGVAGVGVFDAKVGNDLQFRNINGASSGKITVTLDATNDEVDIDVVESALDHGLISGLLDDDHTQYALLAGRSGGQTLFGGTAISDVLQLQASSSGASTGRVEILTNVTATSTSDASLVVSGGVGIGDNLIVSNDIESSTNVYTPVISSGDTSGSVLELRANTAALDGRIDVPTTTTSTSPTTGSMTIAGGVGINDNLYVLNNANVGTLETSTINNGTATGNITISANTTTTGSINITTDTDSTNVGSGALILDGGMSVAKNVNIGDTLTVSTSTTTPIVRGGTGSGADLTLRSTSNSTKGQVIIEDNLDLQGSEITYGTNTIGRITGSYTLSATATEDVLVFDLQTAGDQYVYANIHLTAWNTANSRHDVFSVIVKFNNPSGGGAVVEDELFEMSASSTFASVTGTNQYKITYTGSSGDTVKGWAEYITNGPNTNSLSGIQFGP